MNHCFVNDFCVASVSSRCDHRCGQQNHIPSDIPIYDGHIHLNQVISKLQSDLLSVRVIPPIRQFYFINNNHKPDEWLIPNPSPFPSHVHIYPTIGIHPKYFVPKSLYQTLDNLRIHLEISHQNQNLENKIVAVGECGLDETGETSIEYQQFLLEKQIDFALQFNLPIVLHCRGTHLYKKLFECLKNRIFNKNQRLHWHCINSNANLYIVDLFLNEFPNSYIGLNGSITYATNSENSLMFKDWLVDRSPFLPDRLILETDYPYLSPRNMHGTYDPSCALLATAAYITKTINDPNQSPLAYLQFSNRNIKIMYGL
jgi:TatD DNase family protein